MNEHSRSHDKASKSSSSRTGGETQVKSGGYNLGSVLLQMSTIISPEQLGEAQQMARQTGMDVLKMLTMNGYINEKTARLAKDAAFVVRQDVFDEEQVAQALYRAVKEGIELEQALAVMSSAGQVQAVRAKTSYTPLSELLILAGILQSGELKSYQATANETGLPLGRVITHAGVVNPESVMAALCAQVYEREGYFHKDELVLILTTCYRKSMSFQDALDFHNKAIPEEALQVRLGELLTQCGLVPRNAVISALELSLLRGTPLGQELVSMGQIKEEALEKALLIKELVRKGRLADEHVPAIVRRVVISGQDSEVAMGEVAAMVLDDSDFDSLDRVLCYSGITQEALIVPIRLSLSENAPFMEYLAALVDKQIIDEKCALAAARVLYLVRLDALSGDQAVSLLKYCREYQTSVDQAMDKLH
ncbi:MAG: hypothetical protein IPM93_24320 [Candidatus Obscuribacter sp.]|nr:hypothetical protein [Candidatus Obscuribacter sp.]